MDKKKKPIGYSAEERKSMKTLIERTQKDSGDYVGSGTVTEVPKKKKMKRMMDGGMAEGRMSRAPGKIGEKLRMMREKFAAMPPERRAEIMDRFKGMKRDRMSAEDRRARMEERIKSKRDRNMRPMQKGGMANAMPVRGGGGVPLQGPGGVVIKPRPGMTKGMGRFGGKPGMDRDVMRGGGLARKGVGMAMAKGGMVRGSGCAKRGKTKGKMV